MNLNKGLVEVKRFLYNAYEGMDSMNKLILITGDLAAGKSTFASWISQKFQIPWFCKDQMKEVLGDTIGFHNREENLKLSYATMELMFLHFVNLTKLHIDVILEANFHEKELIKIAGLAKKHQYDMITLDLQADLSILYQRYMHRANYEHRHPVHLSTPFDDFQEFRKYIETGRQEKRIGKVISVQANDFSYQRDPALIQEISDFLKA